MESDWSLFNLTFQGPDVKQVLSVFLQFSLRKICPSGTTDLNHPPSLLFPYTVVTQKLYIENVHEQGEEKEGKRE